jgi:hypothetical protein
MSLGNGDDRQVKNRPEERCFISALIQLKCRVQLVSELDP